MPQPATESATDQRSDGQRARILRIAAELFATKGYHATGVAELSRAVGLGVGALYYHIGSKEELLFTIVRAHIEDIRDLGRAVLASDVDPVTKIRRLARLHLRMIATRRQELIVTQREIDSLSESRRTDVIRVRDEVEAVWQDAVRDAVRAGALPAVDPLFVKVVLGALNHAVRWYDADGSAGPDEVADRIIGIFLGH